jgi:hypothetical protein
MVNLEASNHPIPEPLKRTPRNLYEALLKGRPKPTSYINASKIPSPQTSAEREELEVETGNVLGSTVIDPVHVHMLSNKLQEAREIGRSLQLKIDGNARSHRLEVPANGDVTSFATQALELSEGDLESIEILVEECALRSMFTEALSDVFRGATPDFPALEKILLSRCGEVSQESLGAWLDMLPCQEEFHSLPLRAQQNIIVVLEKIAEKTEFVEASYLAGKFLLSLPGYTPDASREISQSLWAASTSCSIFTSMTGQAPGAIGSAEELLRVTRNATSKQTNSEALLLYIEAVSRFGDRRTTARIISELLDFEIPELPDSTLACLGEEAIATLEKLPNPGPFR